MYKDKDKQRATTRERVKRHREKQKGTCEKCAGLGYIELDKAGLIRVPCKCQ